MKRAAPAKLGASLLDDEGGLYLPNDDMEPRRPGDGRRSASGGGAAFISALSNFSVQYNFGVLSAAVAIMTAASDKPIPKGNPDGLVADYPEPVRAGMCCGVAASRGAGRVKHVAVRRAVMHPH